MFSLMKSIVSDVFQPSSKAEETHDTIHEEEPELDYLDEIFSDLEEYDTAHETETEQDEKTEIEDEDKIKEDEEDEKSNLLEELKQHEQQWEKLLTKLTKTDTGKKSVANVVTDKEEQNESFRGWQPKRTCENQEDHPPGQSQPTFPIIRVKRSLTLRDTIRSLNRYTKKL